MLNIFYLLHYSISSAFHVILSTYKDVSICDREKSNINMLLSIIEVNQIKRNEKGGFHYQNFWTVKDIMYIPT